jgi:Uma2 family endonuclease
MQRSWYTSTVPNARDASLDRVRPLYRTEYDRLVEDGAFEDERVELLDGTLFTMNPQDAARAHTVQRLAEILLLSLRDRAVVRTQSPLALLDDAEPEPDIAVVPMADYSSHHPSAAHLVVEVAASSHTRDRIIKGPIYARAGIAEYWLVDLKTRTVDVHRLPQGVGWTTVTRHGETEIIYTLEFPEVSVAMSAILPTKE